MRAILLASATATSILGLRASIPASQGSVVTPHRNRPADHSHRACDQQPSQIALAHLRYRASAGRVLARQPPERHPRGGQQRHQHAVERRPRAQIGDSAPSAPFGSSQASSANPAAPTSVSPLMHSFASRASLTAGRTVPRLGRTVTMCEVNGVIKRSGEVRRGRSDQEVRGGAWSSLKNHSEDIPKRVLEEVAWKRNRR